MFPHNSRVGTVRLGDGFIRYFLLCPFLVDPMVENMYSVHVYDSGSLPFLLRRWKGRANISSQLCEIAFANSAISR